MSEKVFAEIISILIRDKKQKELFAKSFPKGDKKCPLKK